MTSESWKEQRLLSIRNINISDRIASATFKYSVKGKDKYFYFYLTVMLSVYTVYGCTVTHKWGQVKQEPHLVINFYKELSDAYECERR